MTAPVTAPTPQAAAVAPAPASPPSWTGEDVATVNYRLSNWQLSATDRTFGQDGGYASLEDALTAAKAETAGMAVPAAGVFERDGRFHLRGLDGQWSLSLRPDVGDPKAPFTYLEYLARSPYPDLWKQARTDTDGTGRRFELHPELRAIVDGVAALRTG